MPLNLIELPWLPVAPTDFRQQVRQLREGTSEIAETALSLAAFRLSAAQLHLLGQAILDALPRLPAAAPQPSRLGVLSSGTTNILLPAFCASAARHGVLLDVIGSDFGQAVQQAFDTDSTINRAQCDHVLLAMDHRALALVPSPGDAQRARETVASALQHLDTMCDRLHQSSAAVAIVQTLPQVPGALFGSLDRAVPGSQQWLISAFNQQLRERVASGGRLLLDVAALSEAVGLHQWHDPVQWNVGKFLQAQQCVPLYADWLGRVIGAARGRARKCLVLDLDNTLWGGVIGDDGLGGIVLGNGNPTGEAFLEVQKTALALRERGIVLAVSSKNDEAVARRAFREHPEMLLKEEHIAVFQANWQDKASNLQAIATALNFSTHALVLLDDNPAERAQVRRAIPDVAVPELPDDPAFYAGTLLAAGYFEAVAFTDEDRSRAAQYQANATRAELQGASADLEGYLRSLDMQAIFAPFDSVGRARITQLINKTNQFNLTTRRYTEAQVETFERAETGLAVQLRLLDKFGDNGMICVVICVPEGAEWHIDSWLMSCRVLNRQVELATLNYLAAQASRAGASALIGRYIPTDRNGMVRQHYERLGFHQLAAHESGETVWRLELKGFLPHAVPMQVSTLEAQTGLLDTQRGAEQSAAN